MPTKRSAQIHRKTKETAIDLRLNLDGSGQARLKMPVPFFAHMLDSFTRHSLIDLTLDAKGDVEVDDHHLVEDTGICLGQALQKALGDKDRITRYGSAVLPFDETLVTAAIDLSGRPHLVYQSPLRSGRVGRFDVELVREFFQALTSSAGMNLHLVVNYGKNRHHIIEAMFKATARALREAVMIDPRVKGVPSTKGAL